MLIFFFLVFVKLNLKIFRNVNGVLADNSGQFTVDVNEVFSDFLDSFFHFGIFFDFQRFVIFVNVFHQQSVVQKKRKINQHLCDFHEQFDHINAVFIMFHEIVEIDEDQFGSFEQIVDLFDGKQIVIPENFHQRKQSHQNLQILTVRLDQRFRHIRNEVKLNSNAPRLVSERKSLKRV